MFGKLRDMFGRPGGSSRRHWQHLAADAWPAAIYAIGDVHGCLDQLRDLEHRIFKDAAKVTGEKWLVYLGDYVDRGPDSAGVIDHLLARPPEGFKRYCLGGNHELMALNFFSNPNRLADWLGFGGAETLYSYGINPAEVQRASPKVLEGLVLSHIPQDHLDFLDNLLLTLSVPGHIFVHAGMRPGLPLDQQNEHDLLWIRDEFFDAPASPGQCIVHGHTPGAQVIVLPGRICVDTGAFATGTLSAVRLTQTGTPKVISTA